MECTPRKIANVDCTCFLCSSSPPKKDRIRIFGKSSVDIVYLLGSALDVNLDFSDSSNYFICRNVCYKRLLKLEKLQKDLEALKQALKTAFQSVRTKRLRSSHELDEDTKLSSNSRSAAKSLRFENDDGISNEYRNDDDLLHRNEAIQGKENCVSMPTTFPIFPEVYTSNILNTQMSQVFINNKALNTQISQNMCSHSSCMPPLANPICTSTPVVNSYNDSRESPVTVSIDYPSKTVNKRLKKEYESIGKALVYGPHVQRVAKAVLKAPFTLHSFLARHS